MAKTTREELKRKLDSDDDFLYCADEECQASTLAAEKLENLGYKHIYECEGGKKDWIGAGYEIESGL
jgi:rhodanese-related sulfurtransferase